MGIYLRESGVLQVASILKGSGLKRGDFDLLQHARHLLTAHERLHFEAEVACARAEIVTMCTLGCMASAVVFRTAGRSYAVNDAAKSRGLLAIDPIWAFQSEPPTNPLGRITQDERQRIFAASTACDARQTETAACRERLRSAHNLSDADLKQIDVEGAERLWPPLERRHFSLEPIVEAGLKLCRP